MTTIFPFIIFTYFGSRLTIDTIKAIFKDRKIESWPQVKGKVTWSMVTYTEGTSGHIGSDRYEPTVKFEYEAGEFLYTGDKIRIADAITGYESCAIKVIERYPAGKVVDVFYNPSNPEESYLERDIKKFSYAIAILSALTCFAIGIVLLNFGDEILASG